MSAKTLMTWHHYLGVSWCTWTVTWIRIVDVGVASLPCFSQLANLPGSFPTAKNSKKTPISVSCSTGAFSERTLNLATKASSIQRLFNVWAPSDSTPLGGSGVELMNMPMQPGDARGEDESFRVLWTRCVWQKGNGTAEGHRIRGKEHMQTKAWQKMMCLDPSFNEHTRLGTNISLLQTRLEMIFLFHVNYFIFCFHLSMFRLSNFSKIPTSLRRKATPEDIDSVIMVVGGPDGIKKPIMKDLDNILSLP